MPLTKDSALRKDRTSAYSAMEHRHFATIAAILRKQGADRETCQCWADELRHTNPRFDRARFLMACNP